MNKDFDAWNTLKCKLDALEHPPLFHEREIWWCSIGMNVGFEIFGKDEKFTRPVLVVRKYSKFTFFGLPMTSKRKDFPSHYPLDFEGIAGSILLDQGRTIDSRRLVRRMGRLYSFEVDKIRAKLKNYI